MTQEILISEVLIIKMLMFSAAMASNIRAATPALFFMPTPTMETLAMFSSLNTLPAPISAATGLTIARVFFKSPLGTVNVRSVWPSMLVFWMIISTTMLAAATGWNRCNATPGRSGTRVMVTRASLRLRATPETGTISMSSSSTVTRVPGSSEKLLRTTRGTL